MAQDIERLIVTLEARTKEYERALARAQGTTLTRLRGMERGIETSTRRMENRFLKAGSTITAGMKGLVGGFVGGLGFNALIRGVEGAVSSLARLGDTADKVGLTVEQLQELRFAAEQTGVSAGTLDMAMQRFSRRLGEAVQGGGELLGTLKQYNIAVRDAEGRTRPMVDVLKDYADVIANAGSEQERLRVAFKGFDSEGAAFVNALKEGSAGLERYFAEARAAGIATDEMVSKARELDKQFKAVSQTVSVAWQRAVIDAIDSMGGADAVAGSLAATIKELGEQVGFAGRTFATLGRGVDNVVDFFQSVDDAIRQTGRDLGIASSVASELEEAKRLLPEYRKAVTDALAEGNQAAARANEGMVRSLIETINRLEPVAERDFERLGQHMATAFEQGFKPDVEVSLPRVTRGTGGGLQAGSAEVQGIIDSITRSIAIQQESDPVAKRMLALQEQLVGATKEEVAYIQRLITEEERIAGNTGRTADGIGTVYEGVIGSGDQITGAIGAQTSALSSAFEASVAKVSQTFTSSLKLSVGGAEQKKIDALARERDVISAGLQFKQLSPQDERNAQLRLAEIDLQTAQLNQRMGEAQDALQSLVPTIFDMQLKGRSWAQITGEVSARMKGMLGYSAISPMLSRPGFAGGGEIRGPGGPRSDSVPIMASAGEFMVNAAMTKKHRALVEAINADRLPKMADGGLVGRLNGAAQRLARGGVVQAPAASRGDVNINLGGVSVMAQDGRVSRESTREAGRQVASEVAYHLREMGIHP